MSPDAEPAPASGDLTLERISALDGLRGLAVLGILAINITGFWGPPIASESPLLPPDGSGSAPSAAVAAWFMASHVLFEGKMRALFTLLFGASMVLFDRAAARRGVDGTVPQLRRLGWLALFGYLHYVLLWWGDILLSYALCGVVALMALRLRPRVLVAGALLAYGGISLMDSAATLHSLAAEARVAAGTGNADDGAFVARTMARIPREMAKDIAEIHQPYAATVRARLAASPDFVLQAADGASETVPLMLIGMAILRAGLITGRWSRRRLGWTGAGLVLGGWLATAALAGWAAAAGWPLRLTAATLSPFGDLPGLATALGYGAGFVALWPWLAQTAAGRTLAAAGRCAFTNYLGTSLVMGAIFCGWGLDWGAGGPPAVPRGWLPAFVVLGWALMLAWPRWWLARFGQGPLERAWRWLTWYASGGRVAPGQPRRPIS